MKRPHLLLTNDDGIGADGFKALCKVLVEANFADLTIIAPSRERSGSSVSFTFTQPILVKQEDCYGIQEAFAVDGTPTDCIKLGLKELVKKQPDLIVSGINAGSNAGRNVLHSGTVGAVIEGVLRGIPGVAFSCESCENSNFHVAVKYVPQIIAYLLSHPLSEGTLLNVNFPQNVDDEVRGVRFTGQGAGRWVENPSIHFSTPEGVAYWLGGIPNEESEKEECDIAYLHKGYLTAVPIHVGDLTAFHDLKTHKERFENFLERGNAIPLERKDNVRVE